MEIISTELRSLRKRRRDWHHNFDGCNTSSIRNAIQNIAEVIGMIAILAMGFAWVWIMAAM